MAPIRFRSRHLHATLVEHLRVQLDQRGWITPPINFDEDPATVLDYQPDERGVAINANTVAISLGDFEADEDEELGARFPGGLRSASYPVFIDVYMAKQALSVSICDDIRDIYQDLTVPLVDQLTGTQVPGAMIEIAAIIGPERPPAATGAENFRRYWRVMRMAADLYYNT